MFGIAKVTLQLISDALSFVSSEGSWSLKNHEILVVEAVLANLDSKQREFFQSQLQSPFFIERSNSGRINVLRPYGRIEDNTYKNPTFADQLFLVELLVDGKKNKAQVTMYKGNLFSVEFQSKYAVYRNADLRVSSVSQGHREDTFVKNIDKFEDT